ncbi:hypothetical protein MRX96_038915 [Rhipicephalus microplus]
MAKADTKIVRMSIRNFTDTATPGIAAGRLHLLLNKYFIWAHRFSARDVVQVENAGLLHSIVYLLGTQSQYERGTHAQPRPPRHSRVKLDGELRDRGSHA